MFDKLLFIFLILSPLCFSGGEDAFQYADRFLMMGIMVLGSLSLLFCKPKRCILPKWPLWLILFLIAKLYYFPYHWLAIHGVFNVFFGIGLFYLVANYAEDIRWLYRAVGIVVVVNILYGLMNYFGYNPIFKYAGAPAAFFSTNSDLAGYIIMATPLLAHYARGFGFLVPFVFLIALLQSFTAIICGAISGFLLTARKGFYPMMTLVIIALSIVVFIKIGKPYSFDYKLGYRTELWAEAAGGALRRPLSGYGLGRAIEFTQSIAGGAFTFKNDYLEFGFEVGAIAALVVILFIFRTLLIRYIQAAKSWDLTLLSISLLAFSISLLAQSHLRNPKISPTVMAVLGFYYILTERRKVCG